jgi:hypothetical protein
VTTEVRPRLETEVEAFFALRPDLMADPFPLYRRMREEAPVLILGGVASFTSYAGVEAAIRNLADYSSRRGGGSRQAAVAATLDERGRKLLDVEMAFEDLPTVSSPPAGSKSCGLRLTRSWTSCWPGPRRSRRSTWSTRWPTSCRCS